MRRLPIVLPALVLLMPVGCKDDDAPEENAATDATTTDDPTTSPTAADDADPTSDGSSGEPVLPDAPTFYGDVLPLVIQHCSGCHVEGGIGPFELEDYELAKSLAPVIETATKHRTMPPFNANNDGSCNTFKNARWLSDDEIDMIAAWVAGGAQEGDPNTPQPDRPEPTVLSGDSIGEHPMPEAYQPVADPSGSGYDDYQCFLVDLNVTDASRYLVGYEVIPGNPATTHHLIGFLVDPERPAALLGTNGELMAQLDNSSPDRPGWDCFGAAGQGVIPEGTPVTWAPGGGAYNFTEGTGIRIDPGYVFVVQMHYNLVNGDGPDSTMLRLAWADEVEREAVNAFDDKFLATLFNGAPVEIPPGEESFVWQWNSPVRSFSSRIQSWNQVEILGMLPHMHELGQRMQVDLITGVDNDETCGIYVDRWNFEWQQGFEYETPFIVSPNDSIRVTCEWNTTGKTGVTRPGLGTQDEMCLLGIYAAEVK